jgi:serine/threonine-protein kinase
MLTRDEKEIRLEAISSLAKLADERRLEHIRVQIQGQTGAEEQTVAQAALRALSDLDSRFSVSGNRLSSTQHRQSFPTAAPAHRPEGATQAPSNVPHTQSIPPPPPPPRPEAPPPQAAAPARTLLMSETEVSKAVKQAEVMAGPQKLDIQTLKTGDIIEGPLQVRRKIGKGAFGTVLLMEDTVVDERLISSS